MSYYLVTVTRSCQPFKLRCSFLLSFLAQQPYLHFSALFYFRRVKEILSVVPHWGDWQSNFQESGDDWNSSLTYQLNCKVWKVSVSSVQSLSCVGLFVTPWTAARQASLSIANSWGFLKPMSIELVMPSKHLILCLPLLLPPSVFPSIRVFSDESVLHIRWPK